MQLGFSGHSENWPIESGLVPAQLVSMIKRNSKQVTLIEYDSRIDVNTIKLQLLSGQRFKLLCELSLIHI